MKTSTDYQRHAEECEALARTAVSEEQRVMIAKMADTWRMLAQQRQRHLVTQAKIGAIDGGEPSPREAAPAPPKATP